MLEEKGIYYEGFFYNDFEVVIINEDFCMNLNSEC